LVSAGPKAGTRPTLSFRPFLSADTQVAEYRRQDFAPSLSHQDIILDANTAKTGQVRPGFNGEDHPGFEPHGWDIGPRLRDPRLFVDVESEAMTSTVPECLSQSMLYEYLARGRIYVGRRRSRPGSINRRRLRISNRRMESEGVW
jgi:hypothetical protein